MLESLEPRRLLSAALLSSIPADKVTLRAAASGFDAERAMRYLQAVTAIGPRISGTAGMKRQQALLRQHFSELGLTVRAQSFTVRQPSRRMPIPMTNLIVSIHPELRRRVILAAHYDTRPSADQEPNPSDRRKPFVGANDGGSGVAFLMEIARHLRTRQLNVGVDLVFFDGEEAVFAARDRYFFGSTHFAQAWTRAANRPDYVGGVLLDLIAGKGAQFRFEGHSYIHANRLTRLLWQLAARTRANAFVPRLGATVLDDHLPLLKAGIPTVDIIDVGYRHWHRLTDTVANCAPEPMAQVARVIDAWLRQVR
jgi:glutaminyl-peptide cyclotransferase